MAKPRQHWLPAALIGGFGARTQAGRKARVAVRRKRGGAVTVAKAETVAFERGLYTLSDPPPGLDPNQIDRIFGSTEPRLPAAIDALATRDAQAVDLETILDYVAALAVRHPDHFRSVIDEYRARAGDPSLIGDAIQIARLLALQNSIPQVRTWHWRVIESAVDAQRYILSDLGFTYIGQEQRPGRAIFVPLSPRAALLGFLGQRQGFASRFIATPTTVAWLNAATWAEAPREVYGHPLDASELARLDEPSPTAVNRHGPYRGNTMNLLDE